METPKKITVAIVLLNWNGKEWLEKFLPNLIKYSKKYIIYVADNDSSDKSLKFVRNNYPNIKIIVNDDNYGYAKGYNNALKSIDAEYFVLINSDVEVTKDWIDPMLNIMNSNHNIAACQPKILDYYNRNYFEYAGASGGYIDILGYPFCRGRILNEIEKDEGQYNDVKEIFWATGACFIIRKKYFNEVGGFDEDFFAHQEEIDLCWRLQNIGYNIVVEPKSVVYHVGGGTLDYKSQFKTYLNFRNNLFMLFKNLPLIHLVFLFPIRLLLDGIAGLILLVKKNGFNNVFAIIKAHISFYYFLPSLIKKRRKIKHLYFPKGMIRNSILYKNKILKINKFSDI
jgi:GT2 family glycosyltransferase